MQHATLVILFVQLVLVSTTLSLSIPQPPLLDDLSSIWQSSGPLFQSVYGAPSITNAWGSALVSTNNILGVNAIEMAPFSSGWDSNDLYGWPIDTSSLYINDVSITPTATKWTPYSVIRNNSQSSSPSIPFVTTEVRWVFESQAMLFSANIDLTEIVEENVTISVDFRLPMRYFSRADLCSSWHYPTRSNPCCWNWFPPETPSGGDGFDVFVPTWNNCPSLSHNTPFATLLQTDTLSAASTAFSFPNACNGTTNTLNAPTSVNKTIGSWIVTSGKIINLQFVLVFSNSTDPLSTAAAARSLADAFDIAWVDAKSDWQTRFNSVFDPNLSHFSGFLPILKTRTGQINISNSVFDSPSEQIYYQSIISLLANERTNLPPSLPSGEGPCLRTSLSSSNVVPVEESYHISSSIKKISSNLDRYLNPESIILHNGTIIIGIPRVRGCSFSGGGLSSDYNKGAGDSLLMSFESTIHPSELLKEVNAPWRMFMTGGGLNATTNIFYWDNQYSAQLHAMLEPLTLSRQLLLWTSSIDIDSSLPSQWAFWGLDYASGRGVGNYYSTNDFVIFELFTAIMRAKGDSSLLNKSYSVGPYPNGTFTSTTVYETMKSLATHWKTNPLYNSSNYLADYGLAPNLLECVPSYIHRVASINAANSYMSKTFASIAESFGDSVLAIELQSDADNIAKAVLGLYVEKMGFFNALYPNGTFQEVRHVMDFVYVSQYLDIVTNGGYISTQIALEMKEFVQRELIVPHWMRALSLNDSAAPLSNRSDHGPSGSYIGWPALVIRSFGLSSAFADAMAFLNDTLFSSTIGPYGQAIEIRPPGDPYKPMDVTLYNAMCAAGFADTIIQTFFGFVPPLVLSGSTPPTTPLINPKAFRGMEGVLYNVRWNGILWDIISSSNGVSLSKME